MKDDYGRRSISALIWLLSALVAAFILQLVFRGFGERPSLAFESTFSLSLEGLRDGRYWTLITYSLLHDTGSFVLLHLIVNSLILWFLGRELAPLLGSRRFIALWFGAVLSGGLLWVATNWRFEGEVIGASAGVVGLLVLYACINPNTRIQALLFFIPVTLVPKYVVLILVAVDLTGFVFFEALGKPPLLGMAHSAHLGGMAAGWLYYRFVHCREWQTPDGRAEIELPKWFQRSKSSATPIAPVFKVNITSRDDLKIEVDRILDKINSEGFSSLTPAEKRILDEAREVLSKN